MNDKRLMTNDRQCILSDESEANNSFRKCKQSYTAFLLALTYTYTLSHTNTLTEAAYPENLALPHLDKENVCTNRYDELRMMRKQ